VSPEETIPVKRRTPPNNPEVVSEYPYGWKNWDVSMEKAPITPTIAPKLITMIAKSMRSRTVMYVRLSDLTCQPSMAYMSVEK